MGLKILRFALALAVVTGASGFGLAKVFLLTEPMIAEQKIMAEENAKKVIFSEATSFEKKTVDDFEYEIASKDGKELGILFKAAKNGYSSTIVSLVGVNADNKIVGIVILNQQETPGLGARMEEIQSNKYIWTFWKKDENANARPWYQNMFIGLDPAKLNLVKGTEWKDLDDAKKKEYLESSTVTSLSGATISTDANMISITEAYAKLEAARKKSAPKVEAPKFEEAKIDTILTEKPAAVDSLVKVDTVAAGVK